MSAQEETTAVAIRMQDLSPEYAEIMVLGKVLQLSGYFKDVKDQAQAVTKILFGRELGFSPIIAMGGIHIIEGKPALSSNLMATLIKRSGKYDYRVKSWTKEECVLTFREKCDGKWEKIGESSFTMDDAKTAGVVRAGGSWSKYAKAMLFARAISQGLRTYCPEVSASPIYNPEELGAEVDGDGEVTELPKSARKVEVTTEDIPIKSKAVKKADLKADVAAVVDELEKPPVASSPAAAAPIAPLPPLETLVEQVRAYKQSAPDMAEVAAEAEKNLTAKPASLPPGCITPWQASNFHRFFKEALKTDALRKKADALAHDWLKKQGIVDGDGNPTAKAILTENFYVVREAAEAFAKGLAA